MMTLGSYRQIVRTYLDLEEEDLPDLLLNHWVSEGVRRIQNFKRWPFYEATVQFTTEPGVDSYDVGLKTVYTVGGAPDGALNRLSVSAAEDAFFYGENITQSGRPHSFSEWGDSGLRIWPVPDGVWTLHARGYRKPLPLGESAASTPDLPEDFHSIVLDWVMAHAREHQDYPEEAKVAMERFDANLAHQANDALQAPPEAPLVFNVGTRNVHRPGSFGEPRGPGLGGYA